MRKMSGVLCDRRINTKVKRSLQDGSKTYGTMMYRAEICPVKKPYEKKLNVAEKKMLRWTYVTSWMRSGMEE